jgi:multidrug efflux pump subunit AcrA (membrane-fusion protein)
VPALALLIVAGLVYFAFFGGETQTAASPAAKRAPKSHPVYVATVQRGTISHTASMTGDILANATVEVFSKVEGRLETLHAEQGNHVTAGQVLARIAATELQASMERAAAEVDVLHAQWAQMQAGERPEEIAQARDRVQRTRAELHTAQRDLERAKALYERGLYATSELDDATLKVAQTRAAHATAEKQLQLLRTGARIEDRQALQARLRAAQAALRLAQAEVQNAVITAPMAGIISHRHVDPGAYITDRTALLTIVDMDTVKIKTPISSRDIGSVRPGLAATLRLDAYPGTVYKGTVQRVSPTIDPASRSGEVEIAVANPTHQLKPGMFAKVTLILNQRKEVVLVPSQAVRREGDQAAVFVVRDGKAYRHPVTLGLHNDTRIEILDGLEAGVSVVFAGHHELKDEAPVTVVTPQDGS